MKLRRSFIFGIAMVAAAGTANAQQGKRMVITGVNLHSLKADAAAEGGSMVKDLSFISGFVAHMSEKGAAKLKAKYGAAAVIEEDIEAYAVGKGKPTPPPAPQVIPWGISTVRAPEAWAVTRGAGATACIVDTGIDATHPDLAANIVGGRNFVIIRGSLNPSAWNDDNGHGTHVAGTVAALDNAIGVVGVAPEASLLAVKVLDRRGNGYGSDVADGILACVTLGADVISMSLGMASDVSVVRDAVASAAASGVIMVAATGNEARAVSYPAAYPEVIAVSAVDSSLHFASFSNFGPEVDMTAPGVSVYSTWKGGSYGSASGTSMATPHVTGVVLLMIGSQSLGLVADDIGLPAIQQGSGLINAAATVLNK